MLSWAVTVHKTQGKSRPSPNSPLLLQLLCVSHDPPACIRRSLHPGMSLDYVVAHLRGSFSAGQVHVALSRAPRLDGLHIIGITAGSVRCDATVPLCYECKKKGLPYTPTLWMESA